MATSVIPAIMDFYASLNFATPEQKRIFFDKKPQKVTDQISGPIEVNVPYAVLKDIGMDLEDQFEYKPQEITKIEITIYAKTLEEVDAMVHVVRFNGQPPENAAGLDNTLALVLPEELEMECTKLKRIVKSLDDQKGKDASSVHKAVMSYEVTTQYA